MNRRSPARRCRNRDHEDGLTRVTVTFAATGDTRSQVAVEHDHLPTARDAAERRVYLRERLTALKTFLEADRGQSSRTNVTSMFTR